MGREFSKMGVEFVGKYAFVFPGQSSQYVGMGKDLYEEYEIARSTFHEANTALGFNLAELCFHGPEERLKETLNTQPAIVGVSIALFRVLTFFGLKPYVVAGHSLGEYSALVAAESITFDEAIRLVRERGRFMEEACPIGQGAMAAVLGLDLKGVEEACKSGQEHGVVDIANFNSSGQIVISGNRNAIEEAAEHALKLGAKRCVMLQVSGAFHSQLMKPAAQRLEVKLTQIEIKDPVTPFISNVSADYVTTGAAVKESLVKQVFSPVRWENSVQRMINDGIELFVEVGPGNVLSGLIKRISKNAKVFNVQDSDDLKKVLEILKEAG